LLLLEGLIFKVYIFGSGMVARVHFIVDLFSKGLENDLCLWFVLQFNNGISNPLYVLFMPLCVIVTVMSPVAALEYHWI
jgi:hypothetical protein